MSSPFCRFNADLSTFHANLYGAYSAVFVPKKADEDLRRNHSVFCVILSAICADQTFS
ncbi:MAG: hypothetical protein ACJA15_000596 [Flavobacteriales bacterium]|jgi:hypothetical protein